MDTKIPTEASPGQAELGWSPPHYLEGTFV